MGLHRSTGFMFDIAPYFKPLLVFIEHRYYGKSMPYGGNKEEVPTEEVWLSSPH
ncbi:hypothetical protein NC651_017526 [Populus alba x Populus x berolinensis]|nr:hypothetical protein NC651_017526 [Populus alba x Populus x berolinensis]